MSLIDSLLGKSSTSQNAGEIKKTAVPVLPADIYQSATLKLQDILAPAALEISQKSIKIAGKTSRTFFIMSYPRFLNDGWLAPIVNLDKVFDVGIHIHPIPTEKILNEFKKKVAEVQSQINERESKGLVRDPILDTAYRDLEGLRDSLQQAQEKIFSVGLYLTIYAESEDELFKTENEIRSILESKLIYAKPALFQQAEGFLSVAPIGDDRLQVHTKLNTGPVSSFFPFISSELTDNKGILYGINRHNSGLVIFDRYSLPNYNSVIFATSGAGKSYATKLEILRTMMFDTDVIVIDPEREYEYLAEAVGGRYFNISLSSEHHINPFDVPIPLDDEDPADVLRTHIIHLVGLFRIMLGGLSPEEDSIIDRAITETYALKDITPASSYKGIEPPLMSDFEMVLSSMEGSDSLLARLTKYTHGTWAGFINKPSNVDINRKLVVFSIRDMEDDLKPAAMYIITQFIWNAVRKNIKKRLLVVDEAWIMMKSDDTASFLFMIAKRGRKYFLGLATVTQDVGDFIKSRYGIPIITNSSMQLLLKQSPTAIDNLQEIFRLTDREKYLLMESDKGEGIFFAGLKHVAIKIVASYTEHQIITSDPAEVMSIKKEKENYQENKNAPVL
jgi:conjugal transfer ATP-binding protein TraC